MPIQTTYHRSLFYRKRTIRERFITDDNGIKNGLYTSYYKNGQKSESCILKNGVKQGVSLCWHSNGRIASETFYQDGCREGPYRSYYPDGCLHIACSFKRDQLDGDYKIYNKNGMLSSSYHYSDGLVDGSCVVYGANGGIVESLTFRHGQLQDRITLEMDVAHRTLQTFSNDNTLIKRYDYSFEGNRLVHRINYATDLKSSYHEVLSPAGVVREAYHMIGFKKDGDYLLKDDRGAPLIEATYHNDLLEGERRLYWPGTHQIKEQCPFTQGKEHGVCLRYNIQGDLIEKCHYDMGRRQINPLLEQLSFEKQAEAATRQQVAKSLQELRLTDRVQALSVAQKFHSAQSDVPRRTALKLDKQKCRV